MPSSHSSVKLRHRNGKPTSPQPNGSSIDQSPSSIHKTGNDTDTSSSTIKSIVATSASEFIPILILIFGGCCSNAFTLELATRQLPSSGTLITFAQFLVTTLSSLPHFLLFSSQFPFIGLRKRKVPLHRWIVQVAFYLSTSLLNNMAFAFDVPMAVHIVFRSGGLVINMILGYLVQARRYSYLQISSVILVTLGVVSSTLYSSNSSSAKTTAGATSAEGSNAGQYATGVLLLFSALVLTGFMGLWQERTFKLYGNQNWRESMFYSHLLSLPMFALRPNSLARDVQNANATTRWWFGFGPPSTPFVLTSTKSDGWVGNFFALISLPDLRNTLKADSTPTRIFDVCQLVPHPFRILCNLRANGASYGVWIPSFYPSLLLNVLTQLLCINGVNRLTSKVTSLSVTLVLVVRKAVSLMVSVMLVQRSMGSMGLWIGATMVLTGTVGYSVAQPVKSNNNISKDGNKSKTMNKIVN
ncbi:related to YEA4 - uridine diphosphate-N-acetylglucosamine transporter [Melanopsichium pennsylvanicum]|uniref:Related to YEA4 - uridine diphosphate-N-acetylglucosamine transporter n=2 Tax=Melanopsichium pennsylvanicum TaxID=63383 RepID=A0AAJ4XHS6_9BASI|nr:related to YEA4-uridine diphosphate-N-acetylglucosamine transporter [Melanopsichium pennsylvanicum 4]SNX82251.1 related to YEA4 - uridine diphosphate-N-acetylglucosamine transporter [Melanopsichium pennsylvanicum]